VRVAASVPAAALLFFCHLVPLLFYAVLVAAVETASALRGGRRAAGELARAAAVALPQFVVPAVLYLVASPARGELDRWTPAPVAQKLREIASAFAIGDGVLDAAYPVVLGAVLLSALVLARPRLRTGGVLAVLGLAALYAVAPDKTTTVDHVSIRVPAAVFLAGAAFLDLAPATARARAILAALLAGLCAARAVEVSWKWHRERGAYDRLLAAAAGLPPGSTVFTLRDLENRRVIRGSWRPPLAHAACLCLLRSPVFVPQLFANQEQQPLRFRNASLEAMRNPRGSYIPHYESSEDFAAWLDEFVALHTARELPPGSRARTAPLYVLHVHDTPIDGLPTARLTEIASWERFVLWRLDR
jgi:hypothetical protein